MKCENCEFRFTCYTVKDKPKRIKINWRVIGNCSKCKFSVIGDKKKCGECNKTGMLCHRNTTCDLFEPASNDYIATVYKELRTMLSMRARNTGIPKYCEEDDGKENSAKENQSNQENGTKENGENKN